MSASGLTQWGPKATCDLLGTSDPATVLSDQGAHRHRHRHRHDFVTLRLLVKAMSSTSLNIARTAAEVPASTRPTGASVTWPRYANPVCTAELARSSPSWLARIRAATTGAASRTDSITVTLPAPADESQRAAVAEPARQLHHRLGTHVTAQNVLAALIMLECLLLGGAKVLRLQPMRERAAHVGFTIDDYRRIGALELLAAAGLGIGIAVPVIGVLAACGLLLLLGGAIATHLNAEDGPADIAPAAVVAALVSAYLVAAILRRLIFSTSRRPCAEEYP